jgi:hypothetical protein
MNTHDRSNSLCWETQETESRNASEFTTGAPEKNLSVRELITNLRNKFADMERRLSDANRRVLTLNTELDGWRSLAGAKPAVNVSTLRRRVAFYCHPDRGGDTELMSRLNVLFDFVEGIQHSVQADPERRAA